MKIIVTGVTGFIGGQVVRTAMADAEITHIFTLSRNPLSDSLSSHPKVTSIIHKDFSVYDTELLEKLEGAEACIWMIGVAHPVGDPRPIDIGYTQAASTAFANHLTPHLPKNKKFKFIHTSGILSEKDQSKSLWHNVDGRRSRGDSETQILEFAKRNAGTYEGFVVRPGLVMRQGVAMKVFGMLTSDWCIQVEVLARAMLRIAKVGGESRIFENKELIKLGSQDGVEQ